MASHQVWAKVEEMSLALSKAKDGLSESVELSLKALSSFYGKFIRHLMDSPRYSNHA